MMAVEPGPETQPEADWHRAAAEPAKDVPALWHQ